MSGTVPVMSERGVRGSDRGVTVLPHRFGRLEAALASMHGALASVRTARLRDLPRRSAWRREDPDLPRQRRSPLLPLAPRRSCREVRLALLRVLPHGQPLPPGRRDETRAALRGHAAPQWRPRADVQPQVRPLGSPLRRTLLVAHRHGRRRPREHVQVRDRESRARRPVCDARRVAVECARARSRRLRTQRTPR